MPVTLTASWRAREGEDAEIARILAVMGPLSRQEPGCLTYTVCRAEDDPRDFLIFEQYRDQAAFDAHCDSGHFKRHVLEEAIPRLENRVRRFYSVIED